MPRPSPLNVLLLGSLWLLSACSSPTEHRESIEATSLAWFNEVLPDDQEDLLEHVRELGTSGRDSEDWLVSLSLLTRVALENPSGLVRAEALGAAWMLASELPAEVIPTDGIPLDQFREKIHRFEELEAAPAAADREELLGLASFLAGYRFPPTPDPRLRRLPVDLSAMVSTRATWEADPDLRAAFRGAASSSARHALSLMTLYAADDVDPTVREMSLRSARHLHPSAALNLITGALSLEDHAQVLLAAIESLDALSDSVARRDVLATLSQISQGSDLALRQAADALAGKVGQ